MVDDWTQEADFDELLDMFEAETGLCLCGRDPASAEVREDMVKVMALSLRYGLVLSGCLRDAAAAFDNIFIALLPNEARELDHLLMEIEGGLDWIELGVNGVQVH